MNKNPNDYQREKEWDNEIELLPNAPKSLAGRLLRLPQDEIREIKKFTAKHLQRGTIRTGKGPYAASFFFVKKADSKLHPVQDYRPLNKYTKKNRNVSPLIPQVIDRLAGCTLFTKFDMRWGYNNIRIKEGDEWKAAFLIPQGLFKPLVMFFSLTNSLTTFQAMIKEIFRIEVAQGWLLVSRPDLMCHLTRKLSWRFRCSGLVVGVPPTSIIQGISGCPS